MNRSDLEAALMAAHQAGDDASAMQIAQELQGAPAAQTPSASLSDQVASVGQSASMGASQPYLGIGKQVYKMGGDLLRWNGLGDTPLADWINKGPSDLDATIKAQKYETQEARKKAGFTGTDASAIAGGVLGTSPIAIASTAGPGYQLLKSAGAGFGLGATDESGNSTDPEESQLKKGLLGTAASVGGYGLGKAVGGIPISAAAQKMKDAGVTTTLGQTLGGWANRLEQGATSIPLFGDLVRGAQVRSIKDLNVAAINRSLEPIGDALPKGMVGHEAIDYASKALGKKYDEVLPKIKLKIDAEFTDDLTKIVEDIPGFHGGAQDKAKEVITSILQPSFKGGEMEGLAMKSAQEKLRIAAERFAQGDPGERALADAIQNVDGALYSLAERSGGDAAKELKAINRGWANYKRVERAAGATSADGVFSPEQLKAAVKALDRSKDRGNNAKGKALMQDLADAGLETLGRKVPDSGTPFRLMASSAAGGGLGAAAFGGMLEPTTMGLLGLAAAPYTRAGSKITNGLLTHRPKAMQVGGSLIRRSSPILGAIGGPALLDE